jgi:hypothetical protein
MAAVKYNPIAKWLPVLFFAYPLAWLLNFIFNFAVKRLVNRSLSRMTDYKGHVGSVWLTLFPAGIRIRNITVDTVSSSEKTERFISGRLLEIHFAWGMLLKRKFECTIDGDHFIFNFFKDPDPVLFGKSDEDEIKKQEKTTTQKAQTGPGSMDIPHQIFPLNIKKLEITNSKVEYIDFYSDPNVTITLSSINIFGEKLNFIPQAEKSLADLKIEGNLYGGMLRCHVKADLHALSPSFDLDMELKNMNMVLMNDAFIAYGNFDVSRGIFSVFSEAAARDGKFSGYSKPVINDLKMISLSDKKEGLLQLMWEGLIGTVAELFENQKHDQVATKIPFKGSFNDTTVKTWQAVIEILRNAFVVALRPALDREITLKTIKD